MENFTHLPELKKQLEYYLSDANLARDQFFYSKIEDSTDGFVHFEHFEKCNNIKKLNAGRHNLIEAVSQSDQLELNEAKDAVRRVGNKELPEFQAQKKLKTQGGAVNVNNQSDDKEEDGGDDSTMVPLILFIRDIEGLEKNGRVMEEALGEKYQIKVPFARIGTQGDGGHVLLDKSTTD